MGAPDPSTLNLRLPRSLLDPGLQQLGCGDADGLVAVRLQLQNGRIAAITPLATPFNPPPPLPLAITPPVDPHVHLDKAFSWVGFPNREGTMAAALALNLQEGQQRTCDQVLERGERALDQAWRYGLRGLRSHVDSGGPCADPSWAALLELQRRLADWLGRSGFRLEARRFAPHVTLVRRARRARVERTIAPVAWRVRELRLVRSDRDAGGAVYRTLSRTALEAPVPGDNAADGQDNGGRQS
jgi:cytosine/adenosine deaminase-related metal-dependent hydrolase